MVLGTRDADIPLTIIGTASVSKFFLPWAQPTLHPHRRKGHSSGAGKGASPSRAGASGPALLHGGQQPLCSPQPWQAGEEAPWFIQSMNKWNFPGYTLPRRRCCSPCSSLHHHHPRCQPSSCPCCRLGTVIVLPKATWDTEPCLLLCAFTVSSSSLCLAFNPCS